MTSNPIWLPLAAQVTYLVSFSSLRIYCMRSACLAIDPDSTISMLAAMRHCANRYNTTSLSSSLYVEQTHIPFFY